MSTQTNRNRDRTPYRGRGRGGGQWTPAYLGLTAWYDVHAGGSATQIVDTSGTGKDPCVFGGGAAAPLYLPYTGTAYTHLETAASGTNSISCTAPANTASYSAAPLGGGAPTTGAASAGAFTFTTAGDWLSISLLNGSAVELARFDASASTQAGHTDAYSVAWTVNRGTGRKTTILGPAAKSSRSVALFGQNDYADFPSGVFDPSIGTSSAVFGIVRTHGATAASNVLITNRATTSLTAGGWALRLSNTFGQWLANWGDGTRGPFATSASNAVTGKCAVVAAHRDVSTAKLRLSLDGTWGTEVSDTTITTIAGTPPSRLGRCTGAGTNYLEAEVIAVGERVAPWTAQEIAQLSAYYGGGL